VKLLCWKHTERSDISNEYEHSAVKCLPEIVVMHHSLLLLTCFHMFEWISSFHVKRGKNVDCRNWLSAFHSNAQIHNNSTMNSIFWICFLREMSLLLYLFLFETHFTQKISMNIPIFSIHFITLTCARNLTSYSSV